MAALGDIRTEHVTAEHLESSITAIDALLEADKECFRLFSMRCFDLQRTDGGGQTAIALLQDRYNFFKEARSSDARLGPGLSALRRKVYSIINKIKFHNPDPAADRNAQIGRRLSHCSAVCTPPTRLTSAICSPPSPANARGRRRRTQSGPESPTRRDVRQPLRLRSRSTPDARPGNSLPPFSMTGLIPTGISEAVSPRADHIDIDPTQLSHPENCIAKMVL